MNAPGEEGKMADKLLVRMYAVGFGDCIYVQVPDDGETYHILIDCGTSAPADVLKKVVDDVRSMLPEDGDGVKRLDLLVATHPHADHIKGFDPEWFQDVKMGRIWLSVFMKPDHPQAAKTLAFQNLADAAARALRARSGLHLAPGVQSLLARSIWNPGALKALREGFARSSGIHPQYPLYVARDLADRLTPDECDTYQLDFEAGTTCFRGFRDGETCLRVLAPEWDIDKYYLGQGTFDGHSLMDHAMLLAEAYRASPETETLGEDPASLASFEAETAGSPPRPGNVSERDFRQLQGRLLYSALAFSQKDDRLKNNVSVVLLLEWRGRRLLFTGDAEWHGSGVEAGRRNSTWDVMLGIPEVEGVLLQPLDVFKVAHHGSHNGTPFGEKGRAAVLEKIVTPGRTQVLVSTVTGVHGDKNPVPYPPLLRELGELAANKRKYPNSPEAELREAHQPQRTDLESAVGGEDLRYLQVELEPAD
jgi:beta-lactamase superfamily II metal-dependent hydrolase